MAFGEGAPKYNGDQKKEKQAVKSLVKPAEGVDIKHPKEELHRLKEQVDSKRLFDVSRQVLESVGYSHDQAKEMLDANSELILELKDAVKATIEGCNGRLSVKTSTGETTVLLDMPNRLMISLTTAKGFPLFIDFRDGKNFPFYSKNVNDVISKLTNTVKKQPSKSEKFKDFVKTNSSRILSGDQERTDFIKEYYDNYPYSESLQKLTKLFRPETPNKDYSEIQLRGFIDEGLKITDYASERINDFDMDNDETFSDKSNAVIGLVHNALSVIDNGGAIDLGKLHSTIESELSYLSGNMSKFKVLEQSDHVSGASFIENTNRKVYYDTLLAICECLYEIVGKRNEKIAH
ncbi:MAG: hypothetical protein UT33_C0006G0085 [Candidatus Peregrinibacteria bacterium GW2011_GWC2_39_14]|nr:MAG: hypothetical protein UT33_C0006G0085 [Candidatus Peregrinibacteria bacterium GW2011_GWC2_39_14]